MYLKYRPLNDSRTSCSDSQMNKTVENGKTIKSISRNSCISKGNSGSDYKPGAGKHRASDATFISELSENGHQTKSGISGKAGQRTSMY